jgi:hypothetical protein
MEDPEVPTEHLHEDLQEHGASTSGWTMRVALTAAIVSALAAVASLKSSHSANEAMIAQIESANQWSFFQSKSIKDSVLRTKIDLLGALGKPANDKDSAKLREYESDLEQIKSEAEHLAKKSRFLLEDHETLSHGVTFFQICISVSAMSVLIRRQRLWALGLIFAGVGIVFLIKGLVLAH